MIFLASPSRSSALIVSTISGIEIWPLWSASNKSKTYLSLETVSKFIFLLTY
jgi:hypothetical protein